jgi:putative ATP-binding cassette transporter
VVNQRLIIGVSRNLGLFTTGYKYLIQLIPLLIVAPLYLRGQVEFGVVTQSAMAFAQVLNAFSLIVTQFETLSTFAAVTDRLNMIAGAIEQSQAPAAERAIEIVEEGDDRVAFDGLTLWTAKEHHPLVRALSLSLTREDRLLVIGPNAAAKDALFVATAGIWEDGEGRITRPPRDLISFVPPHPLAISSTLRQRLLITMPDRAFSDDQLVDALRRVGLEATLGRIGGLDVVHDWANALSQGEQHLVAIARLLLARPRFAFLKQVTDALGPDQIAQLYAELTEAAITYLTIGENHQLQDHHNRILELFDGGRWQLTTPEKTPET